MFDTNFTNSEIATKKIPQKPILSKKSELKKAQRQLLRKEVAKQIIVDIGGIPSKGSSVDVITNGQSNAGGFYEVIRDEWGEVNELVIATWIINRHYIDMIFDDLITGKLKSLIFILSNRMAQLGKGHTPNFNRLKSKLPEFDNVNFRVCNSHAKVFSMSNGKDYITVSGSGNWSDNPRIENYTISNSKSRHLFHKKWMMDMIRI